MWYFAWISAVSLAVLLAVHNGMPGEARVRVTSNPEEE